MAILIAMYLNFLRQLMPPPETSTSITASMKTSLVRTFSTTDPDTGDTFTLKGPATQTKPACAGWIKRRCMLCHHARTLKGPATQTSPPARARLLALRCFRYLISWQCERCTQSNWEKSCLIENRESDGEESDGELSSLRN